MPITTQKTWPQVCCAGLQRLLVQRHSLNKVGQAKSVSRRPGFAEWGRVTRFLLSRSKQGKPFPFGEVSMSSRSLQALRLGSRAVLHIMADAPRLVPPRAQPLAPHTS